MSARVDLVCAVFVCVCVQTVVCLPALGIVDVHTYVTECSLEKSLAAQEVTKQTAPLPVLSSLCSVCHVSHSSGWGSILASFGLSAVPCLGVWRENQTELCCVVLVCVVPGVLPWSVSYQLCGIMLVCVVPGVLPWSVSYQLCGIMSVCVVPGVLPWSVSYQLCGIMLVCVVPVIPFLLLRWSAMPGLTSCLGKMNRHPPLCYMLTVKHYTQYPPLCYMLTVKHHTQYPPLCYMLTVKHHTQYPPLCYMLTVKHHTQWWY